jgi:DNA repair protein RecN (Recombination protein N)
VLADGEEANLQSQLYTARQLVTELVGMDSKLSGVLDMLEEAAIQLSEASDELRHYSDRLDLDPNRLFELEQRISRQIALARKHQITRKSSRHLSGSAGRAAAAGRQRGLAGIP